MLVLFETPFRLINNAYPNTIAQKFLHFTGHFESALSFLPTRSTILRIDWNGKIVGSLHGFDKSAGYISHVVEVGDSLFLGSPFNRFVGKVKLPKGPQVRVRNVRYEEATVEPVVMAKKQSANTGAKPTTTPKPLTTTTVKPKVIHKPTTTESPTTTTVKPTTTTRTPKNTANPKSSSSKPTTAAPTPQKTESTPKGKNVHPASTPKPSASPTTKPSTPKPVNPAPIVEKVKDSIPPKPEKLKVIKKGGQQTEF